MGNNGLKMTAAIVMAAVLWPPNVMAAHLPKRAPANLGVVEGPAAPRHRLTIVSAHSCSYCRVFDMQSNEELRKRWMPRGLQLETVAFVISPPDVASAIAAQCGPPAGFGRRNTILFRAQPEILAAWRSSDERLRRAATAMPNGSGAVRIAALSGIDALAPSLGISRTSLVACLRDGDRQRRIGTRMRAADARWSIPGTPTILLDGLRIGSTWPQVRSELSKAFAGS